MKKMKRILSVLLSLTIISTLLIFNSVSVEAAKKSKKKVAVDPLQTALNSAVLTPTTTGYAPADEVVAAVLAGITTPQMTTYEKVKACYDYIINNTTYGVNELLFTNAHDYFCYMGGYETYALLTGKVGVCDDYSATFVSMAKAIGLDAYVVNGQTHTTSGNFTPHAWAIIKINDVEYVFDPQIEDNIAKGGKIGYYRFGKTYAQVADKYIFESVSDVFEVKDLNISPNAQMYVIYK